MVCAVSGGSGAPSPDPKYFIAGMSTRYESTPPPTMIELMRGPIM